MRLFLPVLLAAALSLLLTGCDSSSSNASRYSSGERSIVSEGVSRRYFADFPEDYDRRLVRGEAMPLLFAFHGTGGSYDDWFDGTYDLGAALPDDMIVIYPNALVPADGVAQWNQATDLQFFADILDRLDREGILYDRDRVFVTGHSSGAGLTHEIGCNFGDLVRAIAPVAGSLTTTVCTGSVAVLQIQGERDVLVPVGIAQSARNYWSLYNGFNVDQFVASPFAECVDHSLGSLDFPLYWCLHDEGADGLEAHAWPSFASATVVAFFASLAEQQPSADAPVGGGNDRVQASFDTTLSVTIEYPVGIATPNRLAASLYPVGVSGTAPLAFLNLDIDPQGATGGDTQSYQVPIQYTSFGSGVTFPGTYNLRVTIYVEGGGFPIPTAGLDHQVSLDYDFVDTTTPVVVSGTQLAVPVSN